jgi:hypothetical protein
MQRETSAGQNMKKGFKNKFLPITMSVIPVWLLLVLSVLAQTPSNGGQITGVVRDPAQALVPGSQVTLTNQQTTVTSTVFTDDQGAYRFLSVSPGTYVVRAEAKGFQASVSPPLKVDPGQTVKFDLALKIAETAQTVDVSAGTVENAYRVDKVAGGDRSEQLRSSTSLIRSTSSHGN